jgi:L-asparaginase
MKRILIIFTGGTISMSFEDDSNKSVINDNHNELLDKIKSRFSDDASFDSYVFSMVPSPSFTPNDMFKLGKLIDEKLEHQGYDGADVFLQTKKPVVLTGSMRNFDELGYDGFSNLLSAILVVLSDQSYNRGVLVCLNDEINAANEVQKSHTVALDTFKSLEFGPIGLVDEKTVIYYRLSGYQSIKVHPSVLNKRIEIIKVTAGTNSSLIDYYIKEQIDGLVIEGLGRGNVPALMVEGIKRAISSGITVVITSRCPMGRVRDTYAYEGGGYHLRTLGVLSGGDLTSEKARLKLMLILSANLNPDNYFSFNF